MYRACSEKNRHARARILEQWLFKCWSFLRLTGGGLQDLEPWRLLSCSEQCAAGSAVVTRCIPTDLALSTRSGDAQARIWLCWCLASSADRYTGHGPGRAQYPRRCDRPPERMRAGHFLTEHMIPTATSHALALAHRHRG
jgi:hypothetical protein